MVCRIFTIPKLGEKLKQDSTALSYTPRKFVSHPYAPVFYVVESDHRVYGPKSIVRIEEEKVSLPLRSKIAMLMKIGRRRAVVELIARCSTWLRPSSGDHVPGRAIGDLACVF